VDIFTTGVHIHMSMCACMHIHSRYTKRYTEHTLNTMLDIGTEPTAQCML